MVGAAGVEPATCRLRAGCSAQLSYAPLLDPLSYRGIDWSRRQDSNLRPRGPRPRALARLRYGEMEHAAPPPPRAGP